MFSGFGLKQLETSYDKATFALLYSVQRGLAKALKAVGVEDVLT